jgi:two-component system, NarL family, sensor kinase
LSKLTTKSPGYRSGEVVTRPEYSRLADAHRTLRARIVERELELIRRRLGRELHTGVGQALAGIQIHLGIVQESLANPPDAVQLSLQRIGTLARSASEQVRGVSRRLYAPAWQTLRLTDALRDLWETSGVPQKFDGMLELQELSREPSLDVRVALYRTAQEGLLNAIRHARASRVTLALREDGRRITLAVEDDGGRPPRRPDVPPRAAPKGIGLQSLRELAGQYGGEFQVRTGAHGTRLTISFPVNR